MCACVCVSPCPPGYMQRKALPSSSACTRPAGVSSPPHFSTSSRDGPSLRVSERWCLGQRPVRERQKQTNKQKKPRLFCCTFLLTGGLGLPVGKISQLHLPVDPREVAIPGNKNTRRNHSRLKPVEPSFTRCAFQD